MWNINSAIFYPFLVSIFCANKPVTNGWINNIISHQKKNILFTYDLWCCSCIEIWKEKQLSAIYDGQWGTDIEFKSHWQSTYFKYFFLKDSFQEGHWQSPERIFAINLDKEKISLAVHWWFGSSLRRIFAGSMQAFFTLWKPEIENWAWQH